MKKEHIMLGRRASQRIITLAVAVVSMVAVAGSAQALAFGFTCITDAPTDCGIAESQLSGDLTGNTLTITMTGNQSAVVEQIFIEGAVTAGTFTGSTGNGIVDFDDAVAGGNLPGGNQPFVNFTEAINFAADNPAPRKGIGWHSQDEEDFQQAVFQLVGDVSNLRIGVHVIGFEDGGSVSLVNAPPIPEPSSALVFGLGAMLMGGRLRTKR